jgi:hypothetical protein
LKNTANNRSQPANLPSAGKEKYQKQASGILTGFRLIRRIEEAAGAALKNQRAARSKLSMATLDPYELASIMNFDDLSDMINRFLSSLVGLSVKSAAEHHWLLRERLNCALKLEKRSEVLLSDLKPKTPKTLGLCCARELQRFADGFCAWYGSRTGLAEPKTKVWLASQEGLPAFAGLIEASKTGAAEYAGRTPELLGDYMFAVAWSLKGRAVYDSGPLFQCRRFIRQVFGEADTAILLFPERVHALMPERPRADVFLKWLLVHEALHAFEAKNGVVLLREKDKDSLVDGLLVEFLKANRALANPFGIRFSPPRPSSSSP